MVFADRTLACQDCGAEFTFTASEQEFFDEKGFKNDPKRCLDCRRSRKKDRNGGRRKLSSVVCAECGCETQVPFEPKQGRPVYCRNCFETSRVKA